MRSKLISPQTLFGNRWCICMVAALFVCSLSNAVWSEEKGADTATDEKAIRAAVDSYVVAYNRGDAKAVAGHWSESGEWTSPTGQKFQGKAAIEQELNALLSQEKGLRIEVLRPSIRFVSPDVAIEEGTVRVLNAASPPSDSKYVAVHVKKSGQWKLDSVHEVEVAEEAAASVPLQELAWLAGEWGDDSPDANVAATITWTKNKTFLNYSFKVEAPGADGLEGTQIIGWDPSANTVRSWMFDSDGGFGQGVWAHKGNSWVVTFEQVLPDGRHASATNIYTYVDGNTCTWKSIGRKIEGEFLPNIEEVRLVRRGTSETKKK